MTHNFIMGVWGFNSALEAEVKDNFATHSIRVYA